MKSLNAKSNGIFIQSTASASTTGFATQERFHFGIKFPAETFSPCGKKVKNGYFVDFSGEELDIFFKGKIELLEFKQVLTDWIKFIEECEDKFIL